MPRGRPFAAAVLVVLVVLAPGTAQADVPPFTGPAGGPRVAAVGDSILGQLESEGPTHPSSTRAFTLTLNDQGWRASVAPRNAFSTARVRVLAADALERGAQVVVVVAGAGDIRFVRESADPVTARQQVRRAVRLLLRDLQDVCAVWPTVPVRGGAGERRTAQVINAEIEAAADVDPGLRVPLWATAATGHPEWFIPDGVHLTLRGEAALQRTLLTPTRRCVAALG